ncbi:MAG: UDP-N-acetylmuramate dehydrogenase [Candidatus Paceibacterota bacterium]
MEIKKNVQIAPYTTLKVGGSADFFVEVATKEELKEAVSFAKEHIFPIFVLGGGSNILVSDEGVRGLTIKNNIKGIEYEEKDDVVLVRVGAGESWDALVEDTVKQKFFGLENLSLIPGSIGGAPVQNIGAYGVELKDVLREVEVFNTETGEFEVVPKVECEFEYRKSRFQRERNLIITKATFLLKKKWHPHIEYKDLVHFFEKNKEPTQREVRDAVIAIRREKFPDTKVVGTAGSFFKNPILEEKLFARLKELYPDVPSYPLSGSNVKIPLAWILEHVCTLKGYKEGNVSLYKNHALVLVNEGHCAEDVIVFAKKIQKNVFVKTNIIIEPEVTFVGEKSL